MNDKLPDRDSQESLSQAESRVLKLTTLYSIDLRTKHHVRARNHLEKSEKPSSVSTFLLLKLILIIFKYQIGKYY